MREQARAALFGSALLTMSFLGACVPSHDEVACLGPYGGNPDVVISGCTAVINSGREGTRYLAGAFFNRGGAYAMKRQFDRAIGDFDQAIRVRPDYTNAFYARGIAHNALGQYDRA